MTFSCQFRSAEYPRTDPIAGKLILRCTLHLTDCIAARWRSDPVPGSVRVCTECPDQMPLVSIQLPRSPRPAANPAAWIHDSVDQRHDTIARVSGRCRHIDKSGEPERPNCGCELWPCKVYGKCSTSRNLIGVVSCLECDQFQER